MFGRITSRLGRNRKRSTRRVVRRGERWSFARRARLELLEERRLLSLTNFGPADPINGFPIWFEDSNGVRVELMPFYQGDAPFSEGIPPVPKPGLVPDLLSISAPPEAGNLFSEAIGFGGEAFWWSAGAITPTPGGNAILVLAQEAAFGGTAEPVDGQQFAFGRLRIRVDIVTPGDYTVTTPYGDILFTDVPAGPSGINFSNDVGDFTPYANRTTMLDLNPIGPFLTATNAPAGHLGDPALDSTVTGSPTGNNFFRVTGPDGTFQTDLFNVSGRLFPGEPPIVVNPIADLVVPLDAPPTVIDVSATFTDPDFNTPQGDVLTLSVLSDNPAVVAATLDVIGAQTLLTLTYGAGQSGTANVTLRATDQAGLFVEDAFTVLVTPFFNPPTVVPPGIVDVTVDEDAVPVLIDLSAVFNDPDTVSNGDVLTLSSTNDNPALVAASLAGTQLTLTLQPTANGAATVTVTATDLLGQSITDTFLVTVTPLNDDSPIVTQALADVTRAEDAVPMVINLNGVFADPDIANGDQLTLSVLSDNPALVEAQMVGAQLLLTLQPQANGTAAVDVTATDSTGRTVTNTFTLTVTAVNDNPTVALAVDNVTADEDAASVIVDLSSVFADVDIATNADQLALSILSSNPGLVVAGLSGNQLTLTLQPNANGAANISVTATDLAGLTITDTFAVTVAPVNDNPTVTQTIADMMLGIGKPPVVIDLAAIFGDVDIATNGDQLTMVALSSNPAALTPSVTGTQLTLQPNAPGAATVTVTTTDAGGLSAQTDFAILAGFEHVVQLPTGGRGGNSAAVSRVGANLRVMNGTRMLLNAPLADALSLTILGGPNKADNVTVDLGAVGGLVLPGGIVFQGAAGTGIDTLTVRGTSGDDTFSIGAQAVTFSSATGNIEIPFTGVERLRLDGRAGNDTYAIPTLPLPTTIVDASGTDTLDFSQAATGVNVNLGNAAGQRIFGGATSLKLQSAVTIENVIGTALNDTITGNSRANRIFGGDGDDTLNGGAGNDLLFGGLGNDRFQNDTGNNVLVGGDGADIFRPRSGRQVMIGGLGADDLRGASSSDLLIGGATTFDESAGDLLAILAEWSAQRSIDLRVGNLTQGLGPTLTPFLRPGESVLDDNATDALFGGLDSDWFLSFASDNVMDRGPSDRPV